MNYWKSVIFTDESKFNIFGCDGRTKVWRKPNEELKKRNLRATVKYGGGHVMVWGCFAASGVGNLEFIESKMNAEMYVDILKKNLKPSAAKLGLENRFHFYQDNDPKHKSYISRTWLLYNCPKVIETPPQSPDMNPIENLWEILDRKIRESHISTKKELKEVLLREWQNISPETTLKLVESMPGRMNAVIETKGLPTKY